MPLHGLPYFTPVVFSQKFTIPKTLDNLTIESGKLASAAERGAGISNRMKLHSHTVIPPPAAGWFTSTLAVAQSPPGHCRHVVTGSKPANSAASASSASLCFHAKLPAKLAFVPYPNGPRVMLIRAFGSCGWLPCKHRNCLLPVPTTCSEALVCAVAVIVSLSLFLRTS